MKIWRFKSSICMVLGLAVVAYGVSLLVGLEFLSFGKLTADARDTNSGILVVLFGTALALYGFFSVDKK